MQRHRLIHKKPRFETQTDAEAEYMKVPALLSRHRSRLPSMRDSRSSGGFEKKEGTFAVKNEKVKTCMLMQRMLGLIPSVVSR